MYSPDTLAESREPLNSRNGSSAPPQGLEDANDSMVGDIRRAVGLCVAEHRDGIETLRHCARAARADGVKPERVVLLIHHAWDEIDSDPRASEERDRQRLRLTGIALDSYFADD